jgi:hypothetical protein
MPSHRRPRLSSVLASVLAAGLMLTVASCSHITPIGPAATLPQPRHLRSLFVLEAMRIQPVTPAGGCPAGSVALSGGPGHCYRKLGTPVTITSAAVSSHLPTPPPGQETPRYGFIITRARCRSGGADSGHYDGRRRPWLSQHQRCRPDLASSPRVLQPFTSPHFEITLPSRNQVLQLQRLLVPPG